MAPFTVPTCRWTFLGGLSHCMALEIWLPLETRKVARDNVSADNRGMKMSNAHV